MFLSKLMGNREKGYFKGMIFILITLIFSCVFMMAGVSHAEEEEEDEEKVVRVGWFESKFNSTDQLGRKTGYAYEYQRKVAAYTGWKYEYVEGSWPELFEMLEKGEIDLLGDVSYTADREESILYSELPMGTEAYYIFIRPDDDEISVDDEETLNGKTVGVNKDTVLVELFYDWEKKNGVKANLVELTGSEEEAMKSLIEGRLDAYITLDSFGDPDAVVPAWKIGSSDYYFAVNKNRPDLLEQLNNALNCIQDENIYYNEQLYEKYLKNSMTNLFLNLHEKEWLDKHGKIRVGYQNNYLAFCAKDKNTGELTGALKDYLEYASKVMENAEIIFEPVCFDTASEAMEALKNGEIDCMFPANLTDYDSETLGLLTTHPLMETEMDAVVKASKKKEFVFKDDVTVAVNEGNTNYDMFLEEHYPSWKRVYYKDSETCLEAVAAGKADCFIISNYRFGNISKKCENLHLGTVYTGVDMEYSFAVREGETELYSILSKITYDVPESVINAALTYYSTEDAKTGFLELVMDNIKLIIIVVVIILLIIAALILRSSYLHRKASEEKQKNFDLNRKVFVDALTSVRNKGAFTNYLQKLQDNLGLEGADDFAVAIFDCDNLKMINDKYGHEKGDIYIKGACQLICRTFQHSPVFRIGGDEFAAIFEKEDFKNMEERVKQFYKSRREICEKAENPWEEVHVSMGVAVYNPDIDTTVENTVDRADKVMYENKRVGKRNRM